jgi:DegV family protein with EDD domain
MKSRIGILTDNTVQFPTDKFLGDYLVHTLLLHIIEPGLNQPDLSENESKPSVKSESLYQIAIPSEDAIRDTFLMLSDRYDEIIILVVSKHIHPLYFALEEAISKFPKSRHFHLIDSQTIAIGLGLLVQIAANSAVRGFSVEEIKKNIRSVIPKIYAIFCVKNLSFLYFSGLIDPAQAVIGEMLGITPCLLLENGQFVPTHKAKNFRHSIDLFLEFTSEFINLRNIALLYGDGYSAQDFHSLRSRINHQFSTTIFSEHPINSAVSALFGPQTTGLVIMENI